MSFHSSYREARTGDILLFAGWNVAALTLRALTLNQYTHAGIAVWLNTSEGAKLYCFEAGPCPIYCVMSKKKKAGCRLADTDLLMNYYTKVAVRQVKVVRDKSFYRKLLIFMHEYKNKSFRNLIELTLLNAGLVGPPRQGDGSIFCSELCSSWLSRLGILTEPILQNLPHHLSSPASLSNRFVYPSTVFEGETVVMHDEKVDDKMKLLVASSLFLAFLFYAAVTISYSKPETTVRKKRR